MARYIYSCTMNDECVGYLESTPDEDNLDMIEDDVCVGFTGNGYLAFWKRCKQFELNLKGTRRSVITDTYTGEEKSW